MLLYEAFRPELVKIGLEAEDKDEAFEELVDHLCQAEKSDAREEILEALWERESRMSTGIKNGAAVPHAKTPALKQIRGIVGISKKGVNYNALDGKPVRLLFMLLAPLSGSEMYLRLLKRIVVLLDNHQFYKDIMKESDGEGINAVIKKYEELALADLQN